MGLADQFLQDAGASQQKPSSLAQQFAQDAASASQSQNTANVQNHSLWDETARQLGLTVRAGINGLTGIPSMVGDALNAGTNKILGTHLQPVSQTIADIENKIGLPQPENATERAVQATAAAMAGVAPSVGVGAALANAASPTTAAIGKTMQSLPGMQVTGAAGAGAGGGIARENGAGPVGQIGASLIGGAIGAVAPSAAIAAARGIRSIPENVVGVAQPFTNPEKYVGAQFAQSLGPDAQNIAENIRNSPEYVPGSLPTTAQVGQTPKLVATEKSLANLDPDFKIALAQREADNNNARWQVLNSIAKTPQDLATAEAIRKDSASPLYDAAHANTANVGPAFMRYAQIPEMQEAMQNAHANASLDAAVGRGVPPIWPTPESNTINGSALDYTSRALGDMIGEATRKGLNSRAASLATLKDNIDRWTSRYIPGVDAAAQTYAEKSVPVNTMEAAQQIANGLGTRAMSSNGIPQIQLMPYRSALTKAMSDAKYGIDADAASALQGIGQDLQRATISNSLKSPGSDTAYNVAANGWLAKQLYGQNFEGAGNAARGLGALGAFVSGHPVVGMGVLAGGKSLGNMASKNLNAKLAEMLLNPNQFLPYLDAANESTKSTQQLLADALRSNVNQGLIGSSVSAGTQK
jgi:hypothetical protein